MENEPIASGWLFQLPNYVLAAVMYTLLARFILSFLLAPDSRNYIFRAFVRITDPVVVPVRFITPAAVPHMLVLLFAAIWVLVARVVWVILLTRAA